MPEQLELFDDAVSEYVHSVKEKDYIITGWVLAYSTMRVDDDGDTRHGWDYVVGPQTNFMTTIGIAHSLNITVDQQIWSAENDC